MSKAYIKLSKLPSAPEPTRGKEVQLYDRHVVSTHFPTPAERAAAKQKSVWTEDDIAELEMLYRKGRTSLQIARAMGRPEGAIRHRIRVLISEGELKGRK